MAVSAKAYAPVSQTMANKEIDFDSDAIKVMLCTSTYTPSQAHKYKSSITNEVTGTGYTAGGVTLTSPTVTVSGNVFTFDAADVSWASSTITARYAVVYDSTPASDATRPLICYVDFGADVSSSNATFSIVWDANGIITFTAS